MKTALAIFWSIGLTVLWPVTSKSQEWGDKRLVLFDSIPQTVLGFFDPSYCEHDSLLYFDAFMRSLPQIGGIIYTSKYEMRDEYQNDIWSNPVALPAPINLSGYNNVMADISPMGDTLFFSSNRPGTRGGLDIWMSFKNEGEWSEPVNLGDSINTPENEYAPEYSSISGILFFDRSETTFSFSKIYSSRCLGDGTWSLALALPEIINISGNDTYGPSFDEQLQILYFSSRAGLNIEPIYCSGYSNGEWSSPIALSDSVNGFWSYNYCHRVITENPDITSSTSKLFYDKWVWEQSYCIDFYSYPFYSEALPNAIKDMNDNTVIDNLSIYPNPSNCSFTFQMTGKFSQSEIDVININGQVVKKILNIPNAPTVWNGLNESGNPVSSGVYFALVYINNQIFSRKLVLLK